MSVLVYLEIRLPVVLVELDALGQLHFYHLS